MVIGIFPSPGIAAMVTLSGAIHDEPTIGSSPLYRNPAAVSCCRTAAAAVVYTIMSKVGLFFDQPLYSSCVIASLLVPCVQRGYGKDRRRSTRTVRSS